MSRLITGAAFVALLAGHLAAGHIAGQDPGLRLERVFGPEISTGKYKHPASVTELRNNDSMFQRTPLTAALSTDGDKSYPFRRNIADGRNSFAYPTGFQGADGLIHIVYTSDQRTVINHAVFSEGWVKAGGR